MALNIKNPEVERLAAEVAEMAHETKTEAIRRALADRKERLAVRRVDPGKSERLRRLFEDHIWPSIPPEVRGKPISKREREEILGYGPDGV
ncbi:MAG: protein transcription factor [Acidobacteriales bacterium]|nr:MAG: protein transcription factor [Terriglobales bacterium]